jgi:hypothetical protein
VLQLVPIRFFLQADESARPISWQIEPEVVSKQQPEGEEGSADTRGIRGLVKNSKILDS